MFPPWLSDFASQLAGEVRDVGKPSMPSFAAAMRYRDVGAASDWLCIAFGFHKHLVATSENGRVHYAQLTFGDAMFMLAAVHDGTLDGYMKQPDEIGGAETQGCYLMVSDADAYYARAKASGAEIILEIQDDDFGGRSYACRDPEGHIWNFGTYDPWQGKRAAGLRAAFGRSDGRRLWRLAMVGAGLAAIVTSAVAGGTYVALTRAQPTRVVVVKEAVNGRAASAAQERLNTESSARVAAENAAREAKGQLDRERIARVAAETLARDTRQELDRLRNAKPSDTAGELDRERAARETAERAANQARDELNRERNAKNAALRAAAQVRRQLAQMQKAKQQAGEEYVEPESATADSKSKAKKQKAKSPEE